jgi:hypothetical protein
MTTTKPPPKASKWSLSYTSLRNRCLSLMKLVGREWSVEKSAELELKNE